MNLRQPAPGRGDGRRVRSQCRREQGNRLADSRRSGLRVPETPRREAKIAQRYTHLGMVGTQRGELDFDRAPKMGFGAGPVSGLSVEPRKRVETARHGDVFNAERGLTDR